MPKNSSDGRILTIKPFISYAFHKCLHPRALGLLLGELPVELGMRVSVDPKNGRSVCFPFVTIIEPSVFLVTVKLNRGWRSYLNPRSLYAAEAAQIICAPADFPTP